jgi:hypothetical protein
MRRRCLGLLTVAVPLVAFTLLAGCTGPNLPELRGARKAGAVSAEGAGESAKSKEIKGQAYTATVKGTIFWKDARPADFLAGMTTKLQSLMEANPQKEFCLHHNVPESEKTQQEYAVSGGKVGNIFVWLVPTEDPAHFHVPEDVRKPYENTEVVLHQPHCMFKPHCLVLFPSYLDEKGNTKNSGQTLRVKNDASVVHNTRLSSSNIFNSRDTGGLEGGKEYPTPIVLTPDTRPVLLSCQYHSWMSGFIRVFNHPFATLSKADGANFGTYEIRNAPTGVPLRVVAWHPKDGFLETKGGKPVTLADGKTQMIDFDFRPAK